MENEEMEALFPGGSSATDPAGKDEMLL